MQIQWCKYNISNAGKLTSKQAVASHMSFRPVNHLSSSWSPRVKPTKSHLKRSDLDAPSAELFLDPQDRKRCA